MVLFGSHATGRFSRDSDVDVCVIASAGSHPIESDIRLLAPELPPGKLSIAYFTPQLLRQMCDYGSLFLWHLKLEGITIIGQKYLNLVWNQLKPFKAHLNELRYYKLIFWDLVTSSKNGRFVNECDLSVLFTISRNVCMILAHSQGAQVFGRWESFEAASHGYSRLPISRYNYGVLSEWKTIYDSRADPQAKIPNPKKISQLIRQVQNLLGYAEIKLQRTRRAGSC